MCECYGTIHDPVRLERLKEAYPDGKVPIVYPLLDGRATTGNETYDFYLVDKTRLTEQQIKAVAKAVAPVFNLSEEEVIKDFANPDMKIPLKADGVSVSWCGRHSRAVMFDDFNDQYEEEEEYEQDDDDWESGL